MFVQDTAVAAASDSTLLSWDAIVNSLLGTMGVIVLVVTFVGTTWRLLLREPLVAVVRSGLEADLDGRIAALRSTTQQITDAAIRDINDAVDTAARTAGANAAQTAADSVAQTAADRAAEAVAQTAADAAVETAANAIAQTTAKAAAAAAADATAEKAVNDLKQIQQKLGNQDLKLKTIGDHVLELLERVPPADAG